jgi:methylmalonyl-CoA/ethylmalonyl-CoA epimerase
VITDIDLDHVAVAAERQVDAWPRYVGDLGGTFLGGGWTVGFGTAQVGYANRMRLEVLEPHETEKNDFLRRFLDRNGPGPHHVTFKVKDIADALAQAEEAGFQPVSVDLRDPLWKEAFLHPKQSWGIVVQLAQAKGEWKGGADRPMPDKRTTQPARLDHVAHAVSSLTGARALFVDLLGGREVESGDGWTELAWQGPGRIRLLERPEDLDGRMGAVSHLAFTCERPEDIADARRQDDGTWVIDAADNLGTRLVLRPHG